MGDGTVGEIACSLDDEARATRLESLEVLRARVAERRELADGFAFRFAGDPELVAALMEFIDGERRCCPFLAFGLELAADHGPVWLAIRGPVGTKPLVEELLGSERAVT